MSDNKKPGRPSKKGDRHKPGRHVRINALLAAQIDILAKRNASTAPVEINRAVRELLERENLWPPS